MPEQGFRKPPILRPGPAAATLAVFFGHLVYMMVGLYKFKQDRTWLFQPALPFWGILAVILACIATAAVSMYVAVAALSPLRIIWAAAVTAVACAIIGKAAEGTMLAVPPTASEVMVVALVECLLILPLLWFATFLPKEKRTQ